MKNFLTSAVIIMAPVGILLAILLIWYSHQAETRQRNEPTDPATQAQATGKALEIIYHMRRDQGADPGIGCQMQKSESEKWDRRAGELVERLEEIPTTGAEPLYHEDLARARDLREEIHILNRETLMIHCRE